MTTIAPPDALTPEHRRMLEVERGIPADLLIEEGVYSLLPGDPLPVPDPYFRHPNTWKAQRFPTWPEALRLTSAIVFPHRDHAGRSNPVIRPDVPRTVWNDDGKESRPKYEACGGARLSPYITQRQRHLIEDITVPVVLAEGDPKVMAAVGALGDRYLVVGLSGVDCWSYKPNPADKTELGPRGKVAAEPLPDWEHIPLRSRIVFITFDSDRATNQNVQHAERRVITDLLKPRGAVPIIVQLPCKADGSKMGLDDFVADGRDLGRHLHAALIGELSRPKRPEPPTGTDGAATCDGTCPTSVALREQVRELKRAEKLDMDGPFSANSARIIKHLIRETNIARSAGRPKKALLRSEIAEATNTDVKAVSRAFSDWRAYQDDPEITVTLPFVLADRPTDDGKDHVDLIVPAVDARPTLSEMFIVAERLPRLRAKPGGRREKKLPPDNPPCPKCGELMATHRTRQDVCPSDDCGHVVTYPTRVRHPARTTGSVEMYGAPFAVVPHPAEADPGQNVPHYSLGSDAGHVVPATDAPPRTLIPASMVARDDQELAGGPHYWGDAPPEEPSPVVWEPPRLAPNHHRAWGFRKPEPPAGQPLAEARDGAAS